MKWYKEKTGYILMFVLSFMSIFFIMLAGSLSLTWSYHLSAYHKFTREQAFHIAEAGIHYYKWHLSHEPDNFVSDTGVHDYYDPQGDVIGQYNIEITPPEVGSTIVTIRSTGWTNQNPNTKRTIEVKYGRRSLADYGFLTNSNAWFGETESVRGPIHSNGGIRMDGTVDSIVTSAKDDYICTPEHGCSNQVRPGIWGNGGPSELWDFPDLQVDFESITVDLESIQTAAIDNGLYMGDSGDFGYHVVFQGPVFSVFRVTSLRSPVYGHDGTAWTFESNSIANQVPISGLQGVPIPSNGVIFIEDDLWVSGEVHGRVVVASARLPAGVFADTDIVISDSITLTQKDADHAIGLIAQEDILVPLYAPDDLTVEAVLLAQKGHVFRYYYPRYSYEPYFTYAIRDNIETYGGIITNTIWTWSWVSGTSHVSGYENTTTSYNPYLTYSPPPFWPTEEEYNFISWEEKQ